jgi:hypothetical protein
MATYTNSRYIQPIRVSSATPSSGDLLTSRLGNSANAPTSGSHITRRRMPARRSATRVPSIIHSPYNPSSIMSKVVTKMEIAPPDTLRSWADNDLCNTNVSDTVAANIPKVLRSLTNT